jgi:hypothetical protein
MRLALAPASMPWLFQETGRALASEPEPQRGNDVFAVANCRCAAQNIQRNVNTAAIACLPWISSFVPFC